jgi:hypothetical protein
MSGALHLATHLRERLLTAPSGAESATPADLTRLDVIIDRQTPVLSLIQKAIAKTAGCAIVIVWGGFTVGDPNTSSPRLTQRYILTVWSRQVMDPGNRPADSVVESIIRRLWHWIPEGSHASGEARVTSGSMVPDETYLVYDLEVLIPCVL